MGSEQNRYPEQERRKRWGGCLGALSCFGSQKGGGKRIVPASRIPEGNAAGQQPNGPQAGGMPNQATTLAPSLLAPPSSPASFSNSALPSTAQSPSSFLSLSANSPGGPSNAMYATGPYAHETQLVSPPVFSAFTTEPSTAPLTPPPELAHLTTPSSPDVPFAQFLSSSANLKSTEKNNYDLHATYSLYPGSPASSLISPRSNSGRVFGHDTAGASIGSQDTNFFCPDTFARFYLDHNPPFPQTGGRLSVSKDSDVYPTGGNGHQSRHKDVEELEAYRASFGFSADEIITTQHYVEISDVMDDSFTMAPFGSNKPVVEDSADAPSLREFQKAQATHPNLPSLKLKPDPVYSDVPISSGRYEDPKSRRQAADVSGSSTPGAFTDEEDIFSKMTSSKINRKYPGSSCSDAEIDYRRGRSLRERKGNNYV
ncbi:hypothetical protein M5689_025450 [Euphorbia peplus]|nr:hypothetical protein M5689_025450 [Euphorbia peplus]